MIRVLIVDDEPLARRGIVARLARAGDLEVVAECGGGRDAVRLIRELAPDLVFLDVQMPGVDGFGVIETIGAAEMPVVIFVTAYDNHAIRAFESQALDYLLKPIDDERFEGALARARRLIGERRDGVLGRRLAAVLAEAGGITPASQTADATEEGRQFADRFLIDKGGRMILLPADEIDWVEAAGDYVRLHAERDIHLLRETMNGIERRLDPRRFARIHRSTIVNITNISELHPHFNREYVVILRDGTELKLSRGYRDRLDRLTGGNL